MIPARFSPVLFGLFLSGLMTLVVSGISTFRAIENMDVFTATWMSNWSLSWAVAFPTILVFAPIIRQFVKKLVAAEPSAG